MTAAQDCKLIKLSKSFNPFSLRLMGLGDNLVRFFRVLRVRFPTAVNQQSERCSLNCLLRHLREASIVGLIPLLVIFSGCITTSQSHDVYRHYEDGTYDVCDYNNNEICTKGLRRVD